MYALLLTLYGGCIAHLLKRMHLLVDSSMESEAVASAKAGELVEYARTILRVIGAAQEGKTFILGAIIYIKGLDVSPYTHRI